MQRDSMNTPLGTAIGLLAASFWLAMVACSSGGADLGDSATDVNETTPTATVGPTQSAQSEEETTTMQVDDSIWLRDDRTAVFSASSIGAYSTPSRDAAEAALATAEITDQLAEAKDHTRFVYGVQEPADTEAVQIFFACDQPALTSADQALELLEAAQNIDGGGDCFARATFTLDGTLLRVSSNGGGS